MPEINRRRNGRPFFITIDHDAIALFEAMVPMKRARGPFLSALIRQEAEKRVSRPQWLETLATTNGTGEEGNGDERRAGALGKSQRRRRRTVSI